MEEAEGEARGINKDMGRDWVEEGAAAGVWDGQHGSYIQDAVLKANPSFPASLGVHSREEMLCFMSLAQQPANSSTGPGMCSQSTGWLHLSNIQVQLGDTAAREQRSITVPSTVLHGQAPCCMQGCMVLCRSAAAFRVAYRTCHAPLYGGTWSASHNSSVFIALPMLYWLWGWGKTFLPS